uniref:Potassium channel domain-containing protein n=1 Tax=Panagrolaimus sp. JU765 TaxID=591449 RepID=A0AC34QDK9_9BILA
MERKNDQEMIKRLLIRQQSLDHSQTKEAEKVLEKYYRRRYRNSVFGGNLSHDYDSSFTPELPRAHPSTQFSRSSPTIQSPKRPQSLFFSESQDNSKTLLTPRAVSEYLVPPIKEEIKQRPEESRPSHLWRVFKFIYKKFGLNIIFLCSFIVLYSIFGGAVFYYFEAPEEARRHNLLVSNIYIRHKSFANCYCLNQCYGWLKEYKLSSNATINSRLNKKTQENCLQLIQSLLRTYDIAAGYQPIEKKIWAWNDYWNAVFYAWTLLTTIGYGNMVCQTVSGRAATIIFSIFGIPMMCATLKSLGEKSFYTFQHVWLKVKAKLEKRAKHLQKKYFFQKVKSMDYMTENDNEILKMEELEMIDKDSSNEEVDFCATFPLHYAFFIVFIYISLCSLLFSVWEDWDYFTAFYFFFISLSTIGLGDEIPQQPHYACLFFIFFVVGLALVFMFISIMQARFENKYMAALLIFEEELQKGIIEMEDPETDLTPYSETADTTPTTNQKFPANNPFTVVGAGNNNPAAVKWRRPMINVQLSATTMKPEGFNEASNNSPDQHTPNSVDSDSILTSPFYRTPSMSTLSGRSSTIFAASPVLSVLLSRRASAKRFKEHSLMRLDSINIPTEKHDEHESVSQWNKNQWHQTHNHPPTPSPSFPPYQSPLTRTSVHNAPLSVITEASDEELKEQLQRKIDSKPPPLQNTKSTSIEEPSLSTSSQEADQMQ